MVLFVGGVLLLLASLFCLQEHWLLVIGVILLSLIAPFVQRWLFPAAEPYASQNWILTFGGVTLLLSCIVLGSVRGIWPALWRTLLVTVVSAAIVYAVAYVCGQVAATGPGAINGQPPSGSPIYPLASLLVGSVDILIIVYWLTRKGRASSLSD